MAFAADDQRILSFGGLGASGKLSDDILVFNIADQEWIRFEAALHAPLEGAAAAIAGEHAYIFGGRSEDGQATDLIARASLEDVHVVKRFSRMTMSRFGAVTVALNDREVIIIGGFTSRGRATNEVEIFDITTGHSRRVKNLLRERAHAAATLLDGKVYVCGGTDGSAVMNSCELFDSDKWTSIKSMPTARKHAVAITIGNRMLVKGGEHASNVPSTAVEEFDSATGKWKKIYKLRLARSRGVFARVGNKIYGFAGTAAGSGVEVLQYR
eukprot:Plantae.Rhodophyta-Purpureofilum_apyrenoidigerum.ctg12594.p1 GENE.Plantae.Rhodophyta-Purpureofilum_apyrenoidigerum.ctg12594~~Plantae.Rhodophyta-Purpureofilum_apyrenoidigerum.ctg12594.p1  ORF type:complete len:296 (+),score=46.68 Plantae.Rhodophyta-Purpureofilum_apyrenoidigerum.ctg12594:82-888(+)